TVKDVRILTNPEPRAPAAYATRWGTILLGESLLERLSRKEVDAIVAHELSHLTTPATSPAMMVFGLLFVVLILFIQFAPLLPEFVPAPLTACFFAQKAWRRGEERRADLNSVGWSGEPEGLIKGLARITYATGFPLSWEPPAAWMISHPSTMERIRSVAAA